MTKKTKNVKKTKSLTSMQVEEELKREIYKSKYKTILKSTIYSLITIAAIAVLIATLVLPVLEVNSSSMSPTVNEGEIVVAIKDTSLSTGDVVAFYHGNKILVKRVIAKAGSWVNIDKDGNVYVDGAQLNESYLKEKSLGEYDIEFPYQVPDGSYFVLGDERTTSIDSRNKEIGSISKENIIGKIIFRVWPIDVFGLIN